MFFSIIKLSRKYKLSQQYWLTSLILSIETCTFHVIKQLCIEFIFVRIMYVQKYLLIQVLLNAGLVQPG